MAWFFYSVVLPIAVLFVALAGCVIYWWFNQSELNGVAKPAASANEDGVVVVSSS